LSGNIIGRFFRVVSFGESHGRCVGVVIDGCPAGLEVDMEFIQNEVNRRRPSGPLSTLRVEEDRVEILSGVFKGRTTGAPICMVVWNREVDSTPYEAMRYTPRPGHADYTAYVRYGGYNDYRGGGRFSGRITVGYVMAGALAKLLLKRIGITVFAHTVEIAGVKARKLPIEEAVKNVEKSPVRCGDPEASERMVEAILRAKKEGDSVGGVVECVALGVPPGLGDPVFDTLDGDLAKALMAIPAVKAVEFGDGFALARMRGSEANDQFTVVDGRVRAETNRSGGILGGISSGMPVVFRVAFKPTPSIRKPQKTVDLRTMREVEISVPGRHDPCIVPRAVPIVEAVTAIVLVDHAIAAGLIPRVLRREA